jgi:hypothetical protein
MEEWNVRWSPLQLAKDSRAETADPRRAGSTSLTSAARKKDPGQLYSNGQEISAKTAKRNVRSTTYAVPAGGHVLQTDGPTERRTRDRYIERESRQQPATTASSFLLLSFASAIHHHQPRMCDVRHMAPEKDPCGWSPPLVGVPSNGTGNGRRRLLAAGRLDSGRRKSARLLLPASSVL